MTESLVVHRLQAEAAGAYLLSAGAAAGPADTARRSVVTARAACACARLDVGTSRPMRAGALTRRGRPATESDGEKRARHRHEPKSRRVTTPWTDRRRGRLQWFPSLL